MPALRPVLSLLVLAAGLYALVVALAWGFQDRLVWFPGPEPTMEPGRVGLYPEDVTFVSDEGVTLHGWYFSVSGKTDKSVVLVSHGNGGTLEQSLPVAAAFRAMGHSVLLYDYRGYGRSTGTPSEEGTYRDASAAFDWLVMQGHTPERIAAYGHSLGGAVSVELAIRRGVSRLIVENTFASMVDIGAKRYWFLPVRLLLRIRYDSVAKAPNLTARVLVLHSPEDEMIPIEQGRKLYEALGGPKQFLETSGTHNGSGFLGNPTAELVVKRFLDGGHGDGEG